MWSREEQSSWSHCAGWSKPYKRGITAACRHMSSDIEVCHCAACSLRFTPSHLGQLTGLKKQARPIPLWPWWRHISQIVSPQCPVMQINFVKWRVLALQGLPGPCNRHFWAPHVFVSVAFYATFHLEPLHTASAIWPYTLVPGCAHAQYMCSCGCHK
jgi:hypothetical protein